jgi:hypothetical protein
MQSGPQEVEFEVPQIVTEDFRIATSIGGEKGLMRLMRNASGTHR